MADKVTIDVLRKMRVGHTQAFVLDGAQAIESARAYAHKLSRQLGCGFKTSAQYDQGILTISKTAAKARARQ